MPTPLKTYPSPFSGKILLACRKCQKKLHHEKDLHALARLSKTIKRHNREHPTQPLTLIQTRCMDLCPKRGVTICDPTDPASLHILWNEKDLTTLATRAEPLSRPVRES